MNVSEIGQTIGLATLVSGVVNVVFGRWGDMLFLNFRLKREHEQEQREKLRGLIGEYHGRMLEAAADLDHRMGQFYDKTFNFADLEPGEDRRRSHDQYLYHSLVFRFASLLAIARRFETHAFYIDSKDAKLRELEFLRYAKAFVWVMTHPELTPHDGQPGRDHFRNDAFRPLLDLCYLPISGIPDAGPAADPQGVSARDPIFDWRRYWALLKPVDQLDDDRLRVDELLRFFDGLRPAEPVQEVPDGEEAVRRRWDRLACLHLLVLGFIATFGYEWQRDKAEKSVTIVVSELARGDTVTARAFLDGVPDIGLSKQKQLRQVCGHLRNRL